MPGIEATTISTMLASLPAMLGCVPSESAVLLPVLATEDRPRVGEPIAHHRIDAMVGSPRTAAHALSQSFADLSLDGLVIVLATSRDHGPTDERPFRTEIAELLAGFQAAGIAGTTVVMASRFEANAHWYCYNDSSLRGTLPDPFSTVSAVAATAAGLTIAATLDELHTRFTPADSTDRERLAPLVNDARTAIARALRTGSRAALADRLTALDDAVRAVGEGRYPDNDADIADLIVSLTTRSLHDAMLRPGGDRNVIAAENLALFLWRLSNDPYASRLAAFISALAYQRGDIATTVTALHAAAAHDPFTDLLMTTISQGTNPGQVRTFCRRIAQNARRALYPPDPA